MGVLFAGLLVVLAALGLGFTLRSKTATISHSAQRSTKRNYRQMGVLVVGLVILLATLGLGFALWSKKITVTSTVGTGTVHAEIVKAFTDDDDVVDDGVDGVDQNDLDDCPDLGGVDKDGDGNTSCDPAASGPDPKPRYDKDVARCDVTIGEDKQTAAITKTNVYPSYYCTVWFDIHNNGTIPLKIAAVKVNGVPVIPSIPTPFDLTGPAGTADGLPDVTIHVTDITLCQQIDPGETIRMDIDQHVEQDAPLGTSFSYTLEVQFNQWNEECLEVDEFPNSEMQVTLLLPDGSTQDVTLIGPTTVNVYLAAIADASPTEVPEPDGLEQIPTEIVQMDLTGGLGPITVTFTLRDPAKSPFRRSTGEIEENVNNTPGVLDIPPFTPAGTASSFFDVFFEIEVGGTILHNEDPVRVEIPDLQHKPPGPGEKYCSPTQLPVPLFDEDGNLTDFQVLPKCHIPNPLPIING
jgi:hypothetical protein